MAGLGELGLIRQIRSRVDPTAGRVRLGIGDDCAVLRPPAGHDLLVTTDFSLESKHFRRDWHPPESVGHRCLARGLSDLAAMGAMPLAAFLSLALPAGFIRSATGRRWVDGFFAGLLALARNTGTPLAGGDTATAPGEAILADIVLLGSAPRGTELRRSTAQPGDVLYVTGTLGGSAKELERLGANPRRFRTAVDGPGHPHLFPAPRLVVANRLRRSGTLTAAIDISDGLSTDLRHLCDESGVGAEIDASALPFHALLQGRAAEESLKLALHGGEDYEVLFTARPQARLPRRISGVPITQIGEITRRRDLLLRTGNTTVVLQPGGWEHAL